MKYLRFLLCIALIVIVGSICPYAQAADNGLNGIERYMDLYEATIPQISADLLQSSYQPQTIDCGLVNVTFEEIVFDGRWVYTSAAVVPAPETEVLIMPGSAELGDAVAGGNGEKSRTDTRSFREAATTSQQQLLAVYVYIKEFDEVAPYYFLDHFQEKDNMSILLSGAPLLSDMNELALH